MRARYYEPGSGRFVSEDPARDGMNWFSYVRNDPVNMIDRSGRSAELAFAAAHMLAATIGSYLGQEAAHRIIEAWIQAGLAARQNGFSEDAMDFMMAYHSSDFVNACKGGMAGLLGLAFTALGEVPAGLVGASTMGSVGLTFAVAFAMNFLYATLNDMAAMVLIDIAEGE
jgi:hypothetical protein